MKVYVVALVVVIGILGGFYGGYKFGHSNVSASTNGTAQRTGGGPNGGGFTGGRGGVAAACPSLGATPSPGAQAFARGTVADLSGSSLTVTSTACDVKITFGSTVTIQKQVAGSTSDLQDNQTVTITGTRQADGSIKAETIQIGPAGGIGAGGGAGTGSGSTTSGG